MYLTYQEYQNMGGALDEAAFNDLEFEAEAIVNWYTFNRLKGDSTFPDEVKRLVKYLINLANEQQAVMNASGSGEGASNVAIASQSNDGVSISYNVLSAKDLMDSIKTDCASKVKMYLQGIMNEAGKQLLYRGRYPDE